ncbi:MAG: restriction endonuclease subunit S, partial [Desulfobacterales bacterium]|nr:restriction endonuclease subunit S [Desulfobacterales bacterium]
MTKSFALRNDVAYSLGEVISINPSSIGKDYPHQEIQYVDISSVSSGVLNGMAVHNIDDAPSRAKRSVKEGDTILSTVRPNRRSFLFIKNPPENIVVSTGFAVLRASDKIEPGFLYYTVTNQPFTDYLTANAKGAAYPAVDTETIARAEIRVPPFPTQRKIASILSAYDDLIENNLRRIKVLEEMAQAIYREWFVKFRFPGHEKTRMVDSPLGKIPEGWEVVLLEDVCSRITDGAHRSPKTVDIGYPMASVKDMHDWGINVDTCRKISEEEFKNLVHNDCKMLKNDVLIAKDGSYLKHCFVVEKDIDVSLLSSIAMLRPNERIRPHLLAMTLKDSNIKTRMKGYVSGAALPRIILKEFRKFEIVLPPFDFQKEWAGYVEPMIELCLRLIKKSTTLRRTR